MDGLSLYLQAKRYIDVDVVRLTPRNSTPEHKLAAVREFNEALGNPQAAHPSVQVAGTSGKGSTAWWIANILSAAGLRTGLHVSPYLQVATEKTWVDGLYADPVDFHAAYELVKPVAEAFRQRDDCGASVHGMASLALTYVEFRRRRVDWAVVETGLGGRYDLVQGLNRKLAVITDIGLDHLESLGRDVRSIAWHKAGIMAGAEEAVVVRSPDTWAVFEREALSTNCRLVPVDLDDHRPSTIGHRPSTILASTAGNGLAGFPARNMAVALKAVERLAAMGVPISGEAIVRGLAARPMPGRVEVVQRWPLVLLDGAHNPQKMAALGGAMPKPPGKLIVVFGLSGTRSGPELLDALGHSVDTLIVTAPTLYGKRVATPGELASTLRCRARRVMVVPHPPDAVHTAMDMASAEDTVLCTGSLYLLGEVRSVFYPWEKVLLARSSWPVR